MLTAIADDSATLISDLRMREFSRLDEQRHTYLDYTGSALYGTSQLTASASTRAGPARVSVLPLDGALRLRNW